MATKKELYFKILGIPPTSDKAVIKKAYRKKAFQYHPDRNKLASAHDKFVQLTEAYEYLIDPPSSSGKQQYAPKTAEEVFAERMARARRHYREAQKKEADEDRRFYDKLTTGKPGQYFKWLGYLAALISAVWLVDYVLTPNKVHVNLLEYWWTGPEICFDILSHEYCFDSRQAAGLGKHWEADAYFSPIFKDLKYLVVKSYEGDMFRIYPYRTFSSSFPYVPILMFLPLLVWRFRQPAPWFVFFYFVGWGIVSGAILFRLLSVCF